MMNGLAMTTTNYSSPIDTQTPKLLGMPIAAPITKEMGWDWLKNHLSLDLGGQPLHTAIQIRKIADTKSEVINSMGQQHTN